MAMKKLGEETAGIMKLQDLLAFASSQLNTEETAGFHTSRPAITVFDDDPKIQNQINCHYLIGLAQKGLGNQNEARKAFESVLALEPNHWEASMELRQVTRDDHGFAS